MIDNEREADAQRRRPESRRQGGFGKQTHRAESEKRRVDRYACTNNALDVLQQPFHRTRLVSQYEPQVGANSRKTHEGDADHHRLTNKCAVYRAIERRYAENCLKAEIDPAPIAQMMMFVDDRAPPIPCEVDRQYGEVEHHPAENAADKRRVRELRMRNEVRVRRHWRKQRRRRHHNSDRGSKQHREGERLTPETVTVAALLEQHRRPERQEAGGAAGNVQRDQDFEKMMSRQFLSLAQYERLMMKASV